jgi:hypothetical protein
VHDAATQARARTPTHTPDRGRAHESEGESESEGEGESDGGNESDADSDSSLDEELKARIKEDKDRRPFTLDRYTPPTPRENRQLHAPRVRTLRTDRDMQAE